MNSMQERRATCWGACGMAAIALLAGCSPKEENRTAPKATVQAPAVQERAAPPEQTRAPHPEQVLDRSRQEALLRTIFPDAPEHETEDYLRVLQAGGGDHYLMRFASARTFPDGRLAVVVNGAPADAEGELSTEYGAGTASVYFLQRQGDKWAVAARHEHIAQTDSFGSPGDVQWATLGPGKEGFVVSGRSHDPEGHHVDGSAHLFVFQDGAVAYLGGVRNHQDESRGCTVSGTACMDVRAILRFAPFSGGACHDLLLDFSGRRYTAGAETPDGTVEQVQATIRQTARYRYDGKRYVLVAGANPLEGE